MKQVRWWEVGRYSMRQRKAVEWLAGFGLKFDICIGTSALWRK